VLGQAGTAPAAVDPRTFSSGGSPNGSAGSSHEGHRHGDGAHDGHHHAGSSAADRSAGGGADIPAPYRELQEWVGTSIERLEELPDDSTREAVFELLEAVDTLHREALGRLVSTLHEGDGGASVQRLLGDPIVRSLLELYDLVPADRLAEVSVALAEVMPYIASHGGTLEVFGVEGGAVTVRLTGSCEDCPGSAVTLRRVVEQSLRDALPWFAELVVDEPPKVVDVVPPAASEGTLAGTRRALRRPRWVTVGRLDEWHDGAIRAVRPEGLALLVIRSAGEAYAYADGCPPGSPLTLQLARVEGTDLICPWHDCRYDVRTGRRTDGEGRLAVYPVALQAGEIRIALGTEEIPQP